MRISDWSSDVCSSDLIFTIASIVGVSVMLFAYMQVPTLLGIGRLAVTLELPASGGLYRFSNVTYRGVQVGKVTGVTLTDDEIGRASCRERVCQYVSISVVAVSLKKKKTTNDKT